VHARPDEAAAIAARYIGIDRAFIRAALEVNRPQVDAVRNQTAMGAVLELAHTLGYFESPSADAAPYLDLAFLDRAQASRPRERRDAERIEPSDH
jgi:hypothetical protein